MNNAADRLRQDRNTGHRIKPVVMPFFQRGSCSEPAKHVEPVLNSC